ncbi:MAG TPA: DUF551 domain-containing protein [Bacteroidia bacterium]
MNKQQLTQKIDNELSGLPSAARNTIAIISEQYAQSKTASLQKEIEELKASKWISVEDRLPENTGQNFSEKVLILYDSGVISVVFYDYEFNDWSILHHPIVTHWQPLPEPPTP